MKVYAYKVLCNDLTNIGLRGAPKIHYIFGEWNRPLEPFSKHKFKGGGIWVCPKKSDAKALKKYALNKHGIETRIFRCQIDGVLYKTSCRIKTKGIFFIEDDEVFD